MFRYAGGEYLLRERFFGAYEGRSAADYEADNKDMIKKFVDASEAEKRTFKLYKDFGEDGNPRSFDQYTQLMLPWKMDEKGWISLLDWYGFDQSELSKEDIDAWGPTGGGHGAYLTK